MSLSVASKLENIGFGLTEVCSRRYQSGERHPLRLRGCPPDAQELGKLSFLVGERPSKPRPPGIIHRQLGQRCPSANDCLS